MFKKLLVAIGLRSAPTPIRTYLTISSFVGAVPAALFLGWKYRGQITSLWHRASPRRPDAQPSLPGVQSTMASVS